MVITHRNASVYLLLFSCIGYGIRPILYLVRQCILTISDRLNDPVPHLKTCCQHTLIYTLLNCCNPFCFKCVNFHAEPLMSVSLCVLCSVCTMYENTRIGLVALISFKSFFTIFCNFFSRVVSLKLLSVKNVWFRVSDFFP